VRKNIEEKEYRGKRGVERNIEKKRGRKKYREKEG